MGNNINFIQPRDAWDRLSIPEKAEMMKVSVSHGIYNLNDIRQKYNEFALGGDTEEASVSPNEAARMGAMVGAAIAARPKGYIGGSASEARQKYWKTDNEMRMLTDSVANQYSISPDLLRTRMDNEGYTDARINEINKDVKEGTNRALMGTALFNSEAMPYVAGSEFGLDDVATYINNGTVNLINENWGDGQFQNEKGRWTRMAMGHNYSDNIGIMAATLKALKDIARKDFPNASDADLDRYASAYYNRGIKGGRDWVKRGAKGYKVNKHSLGGNLFYPGGNITYGQPFYSYNWNGQRELDDNGKPILNYNANISEIVITPRLEEHSFSNKGMNANSNPTVGNTAREAGKAAIRKSNRRNSELVGLFNAQNEMHTLFPIGEVSGETIYRGTKQPKVIELSGTDPIGEFYTAGKALGPLFGIADKIGQSIGKIVKGNTSNTKYSGIKLFGNNDKTDLASAVEIPVEYRNIAADDMLNFINSTDYLGRLQRAEKTDDWDFMKGFTTYMLSGKDRFPAKEVDHIRHNADGQTVVDPSSKEYGVLIKKNLTSDDFWNNLNHEVAHWSTMNTGIDDFINYLRSFTHKLPISKMGEIMKYNESIAPIRTWEEYRKMLPDVIPAETLERIHNRFKEVNDAQEKRSRAYEIVQQAKKENMSTDKYIDMFTNKDRISSLAPEAMSDLNMFYTPDNLKKYVRDFLSITAPLSVGLYNEE